MKISGHLWFVEMKFDPRDIWVGIYWSRRPYTGGWDNVDLLDIYVCLIPMLPFHYRNGAVPAKKVRRLQKNEN